ncbi:RNA binding protein, partial [Oryctes borbonicus]
MSDSESRKLADLRVVHLRAELEKRGLDKAGVKQILVERLQKALKDEGLDPEVYLFDMSDKKQKTPVTPSSNADVEDDPNEEVVDKDTEQLDQKTVDNTEDKQTVKENSSIKKEEEIKESKNEKVEEDKQEDADNKETCQDNKEESPIQLTLEEEEVLHDNDGDNINAAKEDDKSPDEKKSAKDAPESAKETTDINPAQHDVKKEEKSSGENSETATHSKVKGISDSQNRNLWITNISQNTRATELKQALSAYGKVIGAKVVINARYPGACCYGYVKMETVEDANNCITKLNNTELN